MPVNPPACLPACASFVVSPLTSCVLESPACCVSAGLLDGAYLDGLRDANGTTYLQAAVAGGAGTCCCCQPSRCWSAAGRAHSVRPMQRLPWHGCATFTIAPMCPGVPSLQPATARAAPRRCWRAPAARLPTWLLSSSCTLSRWALWLEGPCFLLCCAVVVPLPAHPTFYVRLLKACHSRSMLPPANSSLPRHPSLLPGPRAGAGGAADWHRHRHCSAGGAARPLLGWGGAAAALQAAAA